MPKIYLYAEVLTHLRQLTLHASLETEKNEKTKIDVSSDKKIITVIHDGESSSLYLPTQISGTAQVTFPYDKKTEISARVQIEDLEQWKEMEAAGIEAPWNASELSFETSMRCNQCEFDIVSMGTISSWKDLPHSNWADVMDLWFCHKPHEHHDEDQEKKAADAKGFSAQSKLVSEPGTGLVDLVSFALHPDDCNISKTSMPENPNSNSFKPVPVHCSRCHALIGIYSNHDNLVRLDKSSLSVRSERESAYHTYPSTCFVSAQLLELVESSAVRKVIAYSQSVDVTAEATSSATTAAAAAAADVSERAQPDSSHRSDITHSLPQRAESRTSSTAIPHRPKEANTSSVSSETPSDTQATSIESTDSRGTKSKDLSEQEEEPNSAPEPLLLWIFNPDIYYSSSRLTTSINAKNTSASTSVDSDKNTSSDPTSTPQGPQLTKSKSKSTSAPTRPSNPNQKTDTNTNITSLLPHRALKIFYRSLPPSSLQAYLNPTSSSNPTAQTYEPLPLPPHTLKSLHGTLQTSSSMLPNTARTFPPPPPSTSSTTADNTSSSSSQSQQQAETWSVGLLDRYERHPTAERVMEANPLARKLAGEDLADDGRPRVTRWEMPAGAAELYL